jgi:Putative transposase
VKVLSILFRKKFLFYLKKAYRKDKLRFHGEVQSLAKPFAFQAMCKSLDRMKWVVYAKAPFGGPEQVLKYLARYTHRVAISNSRLVSLEDGRVNFDWKDYADANKTKTMSLEAAEFIRRFLLHVLPIGFVRIRHFGFLANRVRAQKLAVCRSLLSSLSEALSSDISSRPASSEARMEESHNCPVCKTGRLIIVEVIKISGALGLTTTIQDTS